MDGVSDPVLSPRNRGAKMSSKESKEFDGARHLFVNVSRNDAAAFAHKWNRLAASGHLPGAVGNLCAAMWSVIAETTSVDTGREMVLEAIAKLEEKR
jgi:hypothetical protein